MRAHGFYMKAGLCQYSHFIWRETLAWGGSRSCGAGIEGKPSVSWTKALPSSSPTCHPVCTQVAPSFIFHLEELKALFPLPKHFPASRIHCDCFSLGFGVCSYTQIEIQSAEGNSPIVMAGGRISSSAPKPFQLGSQAFHLFLFRLFLTAWLSLCPREWYWRPVKSAWGKEQKYRLKDHRPLQAHVLPAFNTHPPCLSAGLHSASMWV